MQYNISLILDIDRINFVSTIEPNPNIPGCRPSIHQSSLNEHEIGSAHTSLHTALEFGVPELVESKKYVSNQEDSQQGLG